VSDVSTLSIRVESSNDFHDRVEQRLEAIESGDRAAGGSSLSVTDDATLSRIFDETTLGLLRAIATHEPSSMRETARLVERDVKDVSRQLHELAEIGVIEIEQAGQSKRPTMPYDEITLRFPIRSDDGTQADSPAVADRGSG
jgi:predicted transcriptional regulator